MQPSDILKTVLAVLIGFAVSSCGDDRFPDYSYKMTIHAGGQEFSSVRHVEVTEGLQAMVKIEGPRDLPRTLPPRNGRPPMPAWPVFVTFGNPANPKTVREVSPESLGASRITIEISDEDVTTGIEEQLGWLIDRGGRKLDGERFNNSARLANRLSAGSFTTGVSH